MEKYPMPPENMPSAPPAYEAECRPPPYYPGPNVPPVHTGHSVPLVQAPPPGFAATATAAPYPQQQYAMPITQAPTSVPSAIIVQNTENIVVPLAVVGPNQVTTTCPMCRKVIKSSTERTVRLAAHLACMALCLAHWMKRSLVQFFPLGRTLVGSAILQPSQSAINIVVDCVF
ncbi:lipopolysaccharide-induced tumor necrosis factor-alpha factor homolog isoform X1 [Nilaparvata lugens]|uniref:lipopolysaccharide-induced tumor necrosis factor-alpha factor homolog isoform X1 n=1 Tax=Nilaparvata lugens TaxID=108931 RepID=UPI00193E7403|nr:lipopolysaccharide-induced tumor necrosis factor-alpha factor homolog isoform X1 [Nilaparvata lugens]